MAWGVNGMGVKSTGVKSTGGECPGGDWQVVSVRGVNSRGVSGLIPIVDTGNTILFGGSLVLECALIWMWQTQ